MDCLTKRQNEIMGLRSKGLLIKQIARKLGIKERSVLHEYERMRKRANAETNHQLMYMWAKSDG